MSNSRVLNSNRQHYKYIFVIFLFFLEALFFIGLLNDYEGNQANVFFRKTADYLADYINVAKYSAQGNPYFDLINGAAEHAYFPLSYVIFGVLSKLSDFQHLGAFEAGYTTLSLAEINIFMIFCTVILLLTLKYIYRENKLIDHLLLLSLFGSGIYLFSYERGNIIFLAVVCIGIFLSYYDSENPLKKHTAFIALAIAAALKGYPALLGVLLIYKKRWKDAGWLMLYGILICIGPFVLLKNGFNNIPMWLDNIKISTEAYRFREFPRFGYLAFLCNFPGLSLETRDSLDGFLSILMIVLCAMMAVTDCCQAKKMEKVSVPDFNSDSVSRKQCALLRSVYISDSCYVF